jgi:hypothetical protein
LNSLGCGIFSKSKSPKENTASQGSCYVATDTWGDIATSTIDAQGIRPKFARLGGLEVSRRSELG